MIKSRFKKCLWVKYVMEVSYYHGDNVIFTSCEYRKDGDEKCQIMSFSFVCVQHQNEQTEHEIQTIMYMAQSFMVHTSLNWID